MDFEDFMKLEKNIVLLAEKDKKFNGACYLKFY